MSAMEAGFGKTWVNKAFPGVLKDRIRAVYKNYNSVLDDCTYMNMNRIFYLSAVGAPMRLLDIVLLANALGIAEPWGKALMICHSVLFLFYTAVLIITARVRKSPKINLTMRILEYAVPVVVLISGVIVTAIDQITTTSILPFLIVCVVFGAIFLIRPLVSTITLLGSYFIYYHLIALTVADYRILLSNRINGATVAALGILISVMNWHYNYVNITQKRRIGRQQKQLEKMAYHDPLTNLYTRHFFNETIKNELFAIERYGHESVIILLDIDDFKDINDKYGHMAGDEVLVQLAKLVTDNVRKSDIVCRFGGDEFVILAPNNSIQAGVGLAEKLRGLINKNVFTVEQTTVRTTASFGVSLLDVDQGHGNYFSKADQALHTAKNSGKNRVDKIANCV